MTTTTDGGTTTMFDTMFDGFRTAIEAWQKTQEAMLSAATKMYGTPQGFEEMNTRNERFSQQWVPFVRKTIDSAAEAFDASFRAGNDFFKTTTEAVKTYKADSGPEQSRTLFDAGFGVFRANADAICKAQAAAIENWTRFCGCAANESPAAKTARKSNSK